jgi:hypothetical protein
MHMGDGVPATGFDVRGKRFGKRSSDRRWRWPVGLTTGTRIQIQKEATAAGVETIDQ